MPTATPSDPVGITRHASDYATHLNQHYASPELVTAIFEGLRQSGKDPQRFQVDDLAAVDQFHTRGKPATVELARIAGLTPGMRVLDVGGGLGGAARTLAAEFGCRVTVLDITEEYCRVGALLTERTGLGTQVDFRCGSALDMPFADAGFDLVWTQHSSMNIPDKFHLYREIRRVLRPGGRLALHEIVAGSNAPVHFPVPWARDAGLSHLLGADDLRSLVRDCSFLETQFRNSTAASIEWFRARLGATGDPPPLGLHLLLGELFRPAFTNVLRNLEEDRIAVIEAVYQSEKEPT